MAERRSTSRRGTARGSTTRKATSRRRTSASRGGTRRGSTASTERLDKSIENFRSSLERSLALTRDRIQEVVDDAVKRGRMTRGDAEEMMSKLVSRGRRQTDSLLKDLERLVNQARREVESRARRARRQVEGARGRAGRAARDAADRPLAEADRLRRRAGAPGFPITAYDQLTAAQVRARLGHLSAADLRKVRTYEKRHANRKGVVSAIEKRLS